MFNIKTTLVASGLLVLSSFCTSAAKADFPIALTDPSGKLVWSVELPTIYTNGCVNGQGDYDENQCSEAIRSAEDSEAQAACLSIGGRLPTREEFIALLQYFEHEDGQYGFGPILTDKGLNDLRESFKDKKVGNYWTSTIYHGNKKRSGQAYAFYGEGLIKAVDYINYGRASALSVRCVQPF